MIQHKRAFCCSDFGITAAAAEGIVYLDAYSNVPNKRVVLIIMLGGKLDKKQ